MVIVFVIDSYNDRSNGTSMTAFRFARELIRLGHEVRIVATNITNEKGVMAKGDRGDEGERLYGVREHYIPIVTEVSRKQHMIFGMPDTKILKEVFSGADIVHFYMPFKLEIVGLHLCREMRIPYITAFHVQPQHISYNMNMDFNWFNHYLYMRFYRAFYRYSHHIHCPSKLMESELNRVGYGGKKYVISNGFELKNTATTETNLDSSYFNIASVGRLSKEKRQDILIKAIAKSKYANKIKLHLHGIGPRESYLKGLCEQLLQGHYEFGYIENSLLMQKICKMDLYVHPAQVESEAISCLEAVSFGVVPVIADSKISATNQFALDNRSIFQTNNVNDLCAKIEYWIEHKEELMVMRDKYKESAKQYALKLSIEKIEQVYKEAIKDFKDNPELFTQINPIAESKTQSK